MPLINISDSVVASEGGYGLGGYNEDGGEDINISTTGGILIFVADEVHLLQVEPININANEAITLSDEDNVIGPLLWSAVGSLGAASSKSSNQASLTLNTTAVLEVGRVAVVLVAVDNSQTTDGDESAVTNLTDTAGNTYNKIREFTNGQGAAQAGACISVWYTKAAFQLNSGQQITASFSNATSRDAAAISAWKFALALGGVISVAGSTTLANDNADPGSLDLSLPSGEYLWIRAQAHERPGSDTYTKTVAYEGTFDKIGTTGGPATGNMTVAGEFDILTATSNPSNPAWSSAADEASILAALQLTPAASPSVAESVAIVEAVELRLARLTINLDEPVSLQEIIQLELGGVISNIPVSINDLVSLADAVLLVLPKLFVGAADSVTVAEAASLAAGVEVLFVETGDNVAIGENIIFRGSLSISVSDTVFLYQVEPALISVADSIILTDAFGLFGGVTGNINLTVFDDVVVDIPEMHVAESLAIAENIQIAGTGIDWFSIGSLGSILSKSADQPSLVLTANAAAAVGTVVVILIAVDNAGTADGDQGAVTGISDQAGNSWQKVGEFANANGAAQAGAVISAWFSRITSQITVGQLITASFSTPTNRDASALTAWNFGVRSSGAVSVAAVATLANDNADPGAMNLSLPLGEALWIRGQAHEGPLEDTWVKTIAYDAIFDKQGTTGGTNNTNMTVAGEFRIFNGTSNPSDPAWTAAADEAAILFALRIAEALAPVVQDSITIADAITAKLATLPVNVNDPIVVADFVAVIVSRRIDVADTITALDVSTVTLSIRPSVNDSITAVDVVTITSQSSLVVADTVIVADQASAILSLRPSVDDAVTVVDVAVGFLGIPLSAFDGVSLAEAATVLLPTLRVAADEAVIVTDISAVLLVGQSPAIPAGDFVSVAEDVSVSIARLLITRDDPVSVADATSLTVHLNVSANDPVTVADQQAVNVTMRLSVNDAVTLDDLVSFPLAISLSFADIVIVQDAHAITSQMALSASDTVTVADQMAVTTAVFPLLMQEDVVVADAVTARLSLRVQLFDDVVVSDDTGAVFIVVTLYVEMGDTVSAIEEIDLHLPLYQQPFEALSIADDCSVFMPYHGAFGADDVTITEFLRVVAGDFMDLPTSDDLVAVSDSASIAFGRSSLIAVTVTLYERADITCKLLTQADIEVEVIPT